MASMENVQLGPTFCTCRQLIGDLSNTFYQLVSSGIPQHEALQRLGVDRICCQTQILSPVTYSLSSSQRGSIAPSVLNADFSVKSFVLGAGNRDKFSVPVSSTGVSSVKTEEEEKVPEETKSTSSLEAVEPKLNSDFSIDSLKFGEVIAIEYERDLNGNIVTEDVGQGYRVPRLSIVYGL